MTKHELRNWFIVLMFNMFKFGLLGDRFIWLFLLLAFNNNNNK